MAISTYSAVEPPPPAAKSNKPSSPHAISTIRSRCYLNPEHLSIILTMLAVAKHDMPLLCRCSQDPLSQLTFLTPDLNTTILLLKSRCQPHSHPDHARRTCPEHCKIQS